ncbi:Uncharacterized conserved protein, contains phage Mu gpF-like domain [Rhizobium sp. RU35A]|uniref:PBECR2 nuclease fold domain-containing protein n=1 Tax=Rhizobium sp. RU35A TaxID=1907414 RepID=UPI0009563408|nr:PBECR2 nuclease fold domain-containing protein [Rhizobium sp. RU35A]SIR42733.1 Uncharacterized conserved protein, contains phage Mu gpF-like domain [Rhizobium sp. RU35A]
MADKLPFQEAIDFLRGKVNLPTRKYDDVLRQGQVRAFTVAGVTRDDLLSDFRAAIEKARIEGTGFNEFRKDFDAIVERTGWTFKGRGGSDEERSDWRARIIYTTNMRTSYMAGRWAQLTDPDVLRYRPYLQYVHSGAEHPRLQHLAWNGLVLAATDPAWNVMYPPNGWGCGCDVKALSKRDLARLGKDGPDEAPDLTPYEGFDRRTGEPELRYRGIDRGWDYNVGKEWLGGIVPKELHAPLPAFSEPNAPATLPALPPPTAVARDRLMPEELPEADYVRGFLDEFDLLPGEAGYFRDRSGGIISVSQAMFDVREADGTIVGSKANKSDRGPYMRLLADAIRDPHEIWVDWASVTSGVVLKRTYLKRYTLPDQKSLFIRFEWTSRGWVAVTGFQTNERYIRNYRKGALLYRAQ